jgi:hypothetical protein
LKLKTGAKDDGSTTENPESENEADDSSQKSDSDSADNAGKQEREESSNKSAEDQNQTTNKTDGDKPTEEKKEEQANMTESAPVAASGDKKVKPVLVKESLESKIDVLDVSLLDGDKFKVSAEK